MPPSNPVKPLIHGFSRAQLQAFCGEWGQPAYRANQLWGWLYQRQARTWAEMTNLPAAFRQGLAERLDLDAVQPLNESRDDRTAAGKLLLKLRDGDGIETALIPAKDRRTVCVSSQVGCKFKCAFCASGQSGFKRNLDPGEIVGQVLAAARAFEEIPSHVVVMGIGEPFDNYDAVLMALRIVNDPEGLCIGARRITLSTCGVVPGIQRLAGEGLQFELSVSLHAPDDELRSRLMPVNRAYPLADLLAACKAYAEQTGRLITFEYTLIRDLNDTPEHARRLIERLRSIHARVNLIPLSPVQEFQGAAPLPQAVEAFVKVLERAHINVTLRASKGSGVNAACGQLRRCMLTPTS